MEATLAGLPRAEYVELPGIGHLPHLESRDLPALVHDFLERHGI